MTDCREIEALVTPYVDGLADAGTRRSVDAHLGFCEPCRHRVSAEQTAREAVALHRAALCVKAPAGLYFRCVPRTETAAPPAAPSWRRWVSVSIGAACVLVVAVLVIVGLGDPVDAYATQLAIDHVKCFQFGADSAPVDAAGAAKLWADAHGWPVDVPSSAMPMHLELRGVRRCLTSDGKVAHLLYRWRGEPLSVFVLPRVVRGTSGAQRFIERFGQEAVIWSERGRTYVMLARGQPSDLLPVLGYVRANAH